VTYGDEFFCGSIADELSPEPAQSAKQARVLMLFAGGILCDVVAIDVIRKIHRPAGNQLHHVAPAKAPATAYAVPRDHSLFRQFINRL
jgi:hypothetical protein